MGGGLLGAAFAVMLFFCFKEIGSYIVITAAALVALLLVMNVTVTQIFRQLGKFFVWLGTLLKRFGAYLKEIYTVLMSASEEELPPREKKITGGEKSSPALAGPATNFSGDDRREEEQVKAQNAPEPFYQKERRLALVEPPDNDEPPSPYQKGFACQASIHRRLWICSPGPAASASSSRTRGSGSGPGCWKARWKALA